MQETLDLLAGSGVLRQWPSLQEPRLLDQQQLLHALGVPPLAPPSVLQVVRRCHGTAYPPNWSEEMDTASGALYFYHALRDEATWEHPLAGTFRDVLELVQRLTAERPGVAEISEHIQACLTETQGRAAEELQDWVGPICVEAPDTGAVDPFYYNQRADESAWEDPRERWQYELQVRYDLLVGFLVAEENESARATGLTDSDLTQTLTTLISTVGSMASTLDAPLASSVGRGPAGEVRQVPPPTMPRFGGLRLPPRATGGACGRGGSALFRLPPHHQRYASAQGIVASPPAGSAAFTAPSSNHFAPPPPPPGAPPRWQD